MHLKPLITILCLSFGRYHQYSCRVERMSAGIGSTEQITASGRTAAETQRKTILNINLTSKLVEVLFYCTKLSHACFIQLHHTIRLFIATASYAG